MREAGLVRGKRAERGSRPMGKKEKKRKKGKADRVGLEKKEMGPGEGTRPHRILRI